MHAGNNKSVILTASEGHILTDGTDYARVTYLAAGADPSRWYEITEAEYQRIIAEREAKMMREEGIYAV